MICAKCGGGVPENQLVCDCFLVETDKETQRIALARFMADQGALFLTNSGEHLLPSSVNALTLCGVRRFKKAEVSEIRRAQLQKPWSERICKQCMEVITKAASEALAQSANEGAILMPIRPELRKFYRGPAWEEVRRRILLRAGGVIARSGRYLGGARCEQCRVPDRTVVVRHVEYPGWWFTLEGEAHRPDGSLDGSVRGSEMPDPIFVRIKLGVAHLDHNPENNEDSNLRLLCARDHFLQDRDQHHLTRATRKDSHRPLLQEATA